MEYAEAVRLKFFGESTVIHFQASERLYVIYMKASDFERPQFRPLLQKFFAPGITKIHIEALGEEDGRPTSKILGEITPEKCLQIRQTWSKAIQPAYQGCASILHSTSLCAFSVCSGKTLYTSERTLMEV